MKNKKNLIENNKQNQIVFHFNVFEEKIMDLIAE